MPLPKLLWLTTSDTEAYSGEDWLRTVAEFDVRVIATISGAQEVLAENEVDCVLVVGPIPDVDRMDTLGAILAVDPLAPVIFFDAEISAAEAVRLHRSGAYHCLDFRDSLDSLRENLEHAVEDRRSRGRARRRGPGYEAWREFLVGESAAMQRVAETIRLVGPRKCTVLIHGESGTGKELAARAIHMASPRANQNMVAINCTALPEHLLEAELFGHVEGAFTGAINARVGRFEQAHKGTLFLDEIGDMPLELQAKLLRVLQDREFQRLGSSETVKVDVRVIAASNVNLLERVRQGRFREDLYYRLNVVPLQLPPLRERDGDIPLLVYHFIQKVCQQEQIALRRLAPETLESLKQCSWPGNVRQLENSVEMAVALSGERDILYPRDLGMAETNPHKVVPIDFKMPPAQLPQAMDFDTAVTKFQLSMLQQALSQTGGNKTAAAELLGMKRTTLIMKLREASKVLRFR